MRPKLKRLLESFSVGFWEMNKDLRSPAPLKARVEYLRAKAERKAKLAQQQ